METRRPTKYKDDLFASHNFATYHQRSASFEAGLVLQRLAGSAHGHQTNKLVLPSQNRSEICLLCWTASYSYELKFTVHEGQKLAWTGTIEDCDLPFPRHSNTSRYHKRAKIKRTAADGKLSIKQS